MSQPETGCYAYCVIPGPGPGSEVLSLTGLRGVDPGFEVHVLREEDLSAVVSEVRLVEFGAEALKRNLEDLSWLERTARTHDAVIEHALAGEAVVPLRLCTIFADEARVRQMLDREREFLRDALERLRGHTEWGVKLLADQRRIQAVVRDPARPEAESGVGARPSEAVESESRGRAFFAGKKRERALGERMRSMTETAAWEAHGRLRAQAEAAILLPPQNRELSHRGGEMVLNGAYLVDASRTEAFAALAAELDRRHRQAGLELELTGPFAPYNFVAPAPAMIAEEPG